MANHKATKKSARQSEKRRVHNRYYKKTARNAVKKLQSETDVSVAEENLPKVTSLLDKLAKTNKIHRNKAANIKSKLAKRVNKLKVQPAKEETAKKVS